MFYRLLATALLSLSLHAQAANSFDAMVVFGDSLSDNGNLAAIPTYSYLNQTPYAHAFTNGNTAVGYLAQSLNLPLTASKHWTGTLSGSNFAVAGARAAGTGLIDLPSQVNAFLSSENGKASAEHLYVLFIGGNDLRDIRDQADEKAAAALMNNAVNGIDTQLRSLIDAGAQHILLVNFPNIASLPETTLLAATKTNSAAFVQRASKKTTEFNNKLSQHVKQIEKQKKRDIVEFDLQRFFDALRRDAKALGMTNTKEACYSSVNFTYYSACQNGALINQFVFFDEIHPTKTVHERVGRALFAVVPAAN